MLFFNNFTGITCSNAQAIIIPQSQNVSLGQTVEFTCSTTNPGSTITWSTVPYAAMNAAMNTTVTFPFGKFSVLRFNASVDTTVTCIVITGATKQSYSAIVLVQSNNI